MTTFPGIRSTELKPTRRNILAAVGGLALARATKVHSAETDPPSKPGLIFPPGCRIGFEKPETFISESLTSFQSPDGTLKIEVLERPSSAEDLSLLRRDGVWEAVEAEAPVPGVEAWLASVRNFAARPDFGHRVLALRDQYWYGELRVGTYPLPRTDLFERWAPTMAKVLASIRLRPQPDPLAAMREHGIALDLTGFRAAFGEHNLKLSLDPVPRRRGRLMMPKGNGITTSRLNYTAFPRSVDETWLNLTFYVQATRAWANNDIVWLAREPATSPKGGPRTRSMEWFGFTPTRYIKLTAQYEPAWREPITAALRRVADSVRFLE